MIQGATPRPVSNCSSLSSSTKSTKSELDPLAAAYYNESFDVLGRGARRTGTKLSSICSDSPQQDFVGSPSYNIDFDSKMNGSITNNVEDCNSLQKLRIRRDAVWVKYQNILTKIENDRLQEFEASVTFQSECDDEMSLDDSNEPILDEVEMSNFLDGQYHKLNDRIEENTISESDDNKMNHVINSRHLELDDDLMESIEITQDFDDEASGLTNISVESSYDVLNNNDVARNSEIQSTQHEQSYVDMIYDKVSTLFQ